MGPAPSVTPAPGWRSCRPAAVAASGSRPGFRRPPGSKTALIRRCSSTTWGSTGRGGAGRSAWTTPTPTSATNRPGPTSGPAPRAGSSDGRSDQRWGPGRGGGPSTSARPASAGLRRHVVGMAVEQHPRRRPVPQDRRRPVEPLDQGERVGVTGQPAFGRRQGARAQHHLGGERQRAQRAHEQPAQVVAGDVLHRRPAGLHDPAVRRHHPGLEQHVAHRSPAAPPEPAVAHGQDAAHRGAVPRRQRHGLADLRQGGVELRHGGPGPHPHGHVRGLDGHDARRGPHLTGRRGRRGRRRPTASARRRR